MTCPVPSPSQAERRALVAQWVGLAYSMAAARIRQVPSLAAHWEDVRAEALEALALAGQEWRPERGAFSTWATWRIRGRLSEQARRVQRDAVHLAQPGVTEEGEPEEESIPDDGTAVDVLADLRLNGPRLFAAVRSAIESRVLAGYRRGPRPHPERDANLFFASYLEGRTEQELAEAYGLPRSTVNLSIQRAQAAFNAWAAEVRGEERG